MIDIERIVERMKVMAGFKSDKDIASMLGLSSADFSNRKRRETLLPVIIDWAVVRNVDLDLLIRGDESGSRRVAIRKSRELLEGTDYDVYDMSCSKAPGDWPLYKPIERMIISDQYAGELMLLKMSGSSMEPTIHDGAIFALEVDIDRFVSGKVYVLWIPGEGPVVRRVFVDLEKLTLRADNPLFPDIVISLNEIPKGKFQLGYVVWVLQNI